MNFGLTVHKLAVSSSYKGQILLINNGKWALHGRAHHVGQADGHQRSGGRHRTLYHWEGATTRH